MISIQKLTNGGNDAKKYDIKLIKIGIEDWNGCVTACPRNY